MTAERRVSNSPKLRNGFLQSLVAVRLQFVLSAFWQSNVDDVHAVMRRSRHDQTMRHRHHRRRRRHHYRHVLTRSACELAQSQYVDGLG